MDRAILKLQKAPRRGVHFTHWPEKTRRSMNPIGWPRVCFGSEARRNTVVEGPPPHLSTPLVALLSFLTPQRGRGRVPGDVRRRAGEMTQRPRLVHAPY